jgi:hypothetical protein
VITTDDRKSNTPSVVSSAVSLISFFFSSTPLRPIVGTCPLAAVAAAPSLWAIYLNRCLTTDGLNLMTVKWDRVI